jgi:hypothetical protein
MAMELVAQLPYNHPYRWDGTLFGRPKLWRPSDIGSSLALWLDAQDTASITLNGSNVSQWNDKSGSGRHAAQPTAISQPTYGVTNGVQAVNFNGSTGLTCATNIQINAGLTAFTVISFATTSFGFTRHLSQFDGATTNGRWMLSPNSSIYNRFYVDANGVASGPIVDQPAPVTVNTLPNILGGTYTPLTNAVAHYNGTSSTAIANNGTPSASNLNPLIVGGSLNGAVYEVVTATAALSTDDRQKLEGYFAWKWGIVSVLPSNHPYKLLPPTA